LNIAGKIGFMVARDCGKALRLPEFKNFARHWDHVLKAHVVKILPGQYYVTRRKELLITTLGSCVSACIRDAKIGIGGMNHFMLPHKIRLSEREDEDSAWNVAARYGNFAMELLINAILRNGGKRTNLEIKVFGGARVLPHMRNIGGLNVEFIRKYLKTDGLPIVAEDLGGSQPRKVIYDPETGAVRVKKISPLKSSGIARREKAYKTDLEKKDIFGIVELFDDSKMD
jgi:chemotaxis protein CheD